MTGPLNLQPCSDCGGQLGRHTYACRRRPSDLRDIDLAAPFYVEARVGSANYSGECVKFIQDRRGGDGQYINVPAEDILRQLLTVAAAAGLIGPRAVGPHTPEATVIRERAGKRRAGVLLSHITLGGRPEYCEVRWLSARQKTAKRYVELEVMMGEDSPQEVR